MTKMLMQAGLASILLLSGCTDTSSYAPPSGQPVTISGNVAAAFKDYQQMIGYTHPGAFAVSESGRKSYYFYCTDTICNQGIVFSREAVRHCEDWGERCYVFARNHEAIYPFQVAN